MTVMERVNVLGMAFDNHTMAEFMTILGKRMRQEQGTFIVTANPEIVMYAREHPEYQRLVDEADFVTADGIGVVKGAQILGTPIKERVTGFDLMVNLLQLAAQQGYRVYLIGAKPGIADAAAKKAAQEFPGLQIVGTHDGYFELGDTQVDQAIIAAKPDMVFAAMGYPRQEQFIAALRNHLPDALFMGVGGSFDVLSGTVKRAPVFMQKAHLEWFYRLLKEPTRFKRMLILPKFLRVVHQEAKKPK
ncbi:UDP-N-acetyl-D-mannosamine transferase [Schleiferilactobacillus perolens DSM 12744]|uniref:N-acetylglucosaminyldiphosphoundecaprenol N-acetyl-beta-D-mannosaminyltransferase n=2 Tax=Schleiferilactobacillus perolens TaxID=100468 RepID=A0A0R1MYB7_9LACO|nr:UDP-N-acetyl-D-mannosamine transferase [Schleiferilactobacillus perolens DSM 12744]